MPRLSFRGASVFLGWKQCGKTSCHGNDKSFFSVLTVNGRGVLCTLRFFTEVLATTVSMKLGGLLLRV